MTLPKIIEGLREWAWMEPMIGDLLDQLETELGSTLKQVPIAGVRFVVSPDGNHVTSYNEETGERIKTVPLACALGWTKALLSTLRYSEIPE